MLLLVACGHGTGSLKWLAVLDRPWIVEGTSSMEVSIFSMLD